MNNTEIHAIREFDILEKTIDDPIILPFKKEILELVKAFGNSGQSGGSAPYTASAISQAVKTLCMQRPICDITGSDDEWNDVTEMNSKELLYQNNRESAIFKHGKDGHAYYLDAIIWQGEEDYDTFTGSVYLDDISFKLITSRQFVNFPFKPKSFYINVIRIPITEDEAEQRNLHYIKDSFDKCYYTVIKDKDQLGKVFDYYGLKLFE